MSYASGSALPPHLPALAGSELLRELEEVQATVGPAYPNADAKVLPRLDRHSRRFIELSPFCCIGTVGADGGLDVSPRGDPAGFVKVLDDTTIVLPERVGNRRIDTLRNVIEVPSVGLLFFVPGLGETLRVNGRAAVLAPGSPVLAGMDVKGRAPLSGIAVHVEEVYFHCGRALLRSQLWDPDTQAAAAGFPRMGVVMRDQMALAQGTEEQIEAALQESYEHLYDDAGAAEQEAGAGD